MAIVIHPNDQMLVAIKAELLHGMPELTGAQINAAAMIALVAIRRNDVEIMKGSIPRTTLNIPMPAGASQPPSSP